MEQKHYRNQRSYSIRKIGITVGVGLICLTEQNAANSNVQLENHFSNNIRLLQDDTKTTPVSTPAKTDDSSITKDDTPVATNEKQNETTPTNDPVVNDNTAAKKDNTPASSQDKTVKDDKSSVAVKDDTQSVSKDNSQSQTTQVSNGDSKKQDNSSKPSNNSKSQDNSQISSPKDSTPSDNNSTPNIDNENAKNDVKEKEQKIKELKNQNRRREEIEEYAVILISLMLGSFFAGCFYQLFSPERTDIEVADESIEAKKQSCVSDLKPMKLNTVAVEETGVGVVATNNFLKGNMQVHPDNSNSNSRGIGHLTSSASFLQPQALSDQNMTAQNEIGQVMLSPELNLDIEAPKRAGLSDRAMAPSGGKRLPPIELPRTKPTSSIDKDRSLQ